MPLGKIIVFPFSFGLFWVRTVNANLNPQFRQSQVGFITIVFCLPTANPVTSQTLNYTPVAVGIVSVATLGSWFLSARHWFTGPLRQVGLDLNTSSTEEAKTEIPIEKGAREEST